MKILIVDDNADIRRVAFLALSKVGKMDVIEAGSGQIGIQKAKEEKPDVILLDVMMPLMGGVETFECLQKDSETKKIPVVFLTAKAMVSEVERLRSIGAKGVLTKPFDPITLSDEVCSLLTKNRN